MTWASFQHTAPPVVKLAVTPCVATPACYPAQGLPLSPPPGLLTHMEADLQQTPQQRAPQQDAQQRRPQVTQAVTVPLTAPAASAASSGNGAHGAGHERVTCRANGATLGAERGQCDVARVDPQRTPAGFGLDAPFATHAVKGWQAVTTQTVWLSCHAQQRALPATLHTLPVTTTLVVPQAMLQFPPALTVPTAAPGAAGQIISSVSG